MLNESEHPWRVIQQIRPALNEFFPQRARSQRNLEESHLWEGHTRRIFPDSLSPLSFFSPEYKLSLAPGFRFLTGRLRLINFNQDDASSVFTELHYQLSPTEFAGLPPVFLSPKLIRCLNIAFPTTLSLKE